MSKFDSRVLDWVKGARVQPEGKISVLDNGIGCINKFERIESHEPVRSRSPLRRQNSGDVMIVEKMDTEKSNAVREKQNTENWAPPTPQREPFQPMGRKVPSCGVAWMRSNGTLRLQLALKKLPYEMQQDILRLPVKVPELATRGNILLLEYPQEHPGYTGMAMHIGPIQAGCSAEIPTLEKWPYELPPLPAHAEKLKPRQAHHPPPIKDPEEVAKENAKIRRGSRQEKNLESAEAPENKTKLKLKKKTPTVRRKVLPQWPPLAEDADPETPAATPASTSASPNRPAAVNKLARQWPPAGCGLDEGEEAASPIPSPLPSSGAGSPGYGPRNSRSSSMWTGSPMQSPAARRTWGSPVPPATPASPTPDESSKLVERKTDALPERKAEQSSSPSRPRAPWGVAWTPDRSEYNSPPRSSSQSHSPVARRSLPGGSLFSDSHWNGQGDAASQPSSPAPRRAPRSPFQKTNTHTPRQKSSNPLFSDAHWDPDRTESDLPSVAAEGRPRSQTTVPSLTAIKRGGSPRKKWPTVEYTPRSKMSPAAKTPTGEWKRDDEATAATKQAEDDYVDLASPGREVQKLDLKSKFGAYLHEEEGAEKKA